MTIKQLSVFVENRPGRLSAITNILAKANINIRAITTADSRDFGILRLIVDNTDAAIEALKANDVIVTVSNVIAATAQDTPGGMAGMMDVLYKDNISVEYMYSAFVSEKNEEAYLILRADSNEAAEQALESKYKLISQEELLNM